MAKKLLPLLFLALLAGCFKEKELQSLTFTMPEVNEENCKTEAIQAMPDIPERQEFAGKCFRRKKPVRNGSNVGIRAY